MAISFNPRTTPVQNSVWNPAISTELYAQGFANQAKNTKEYQQEFQNSADEFLGIQAMSPQDQEVLDGYKQQFLKDVGNLNVGNLNSPQAKQQLSQYITQYSSNPDILGIAQRTNALQQDKALEKEYELKGKKYVSKLQRQAQKYIQDGNYYTDTRFNQSGYVSPETKDITEWSKSVPEWTKYVENGVYDDKQEGKAVGQLYNRILQGFQTDENWKALHKDNFEQSIEGQNIYDYVNSPAEAVAQLFPNLPEGSLEQQKAIKTIQELKSLGQNPYAESAIKNRMEDLYIRDQAAMAAQAEQYTNTVEHKWNEVKKDATDFSQAKQIELYKAITPGALALGFTPEQIMSGKAKDAQGNVLTIADAIQKSQDFKIAEAQAKQDIKTNSALVVEEVKQANRLEAIDKRIENKAISGVENKSLKKLFTDLDAGDLSDNSQTSLENVLKNNRGLLGIKDGADLTNIQFKEEDGVKYITYERDQWGSNEEGKIPLKDFEKKLLGTTSQLTKEEWNAEWANLKAGETIVGLDGKTYTK